MFSHLLNLRKLIRALVCIFFVFAITVVNLPHSPIFSNSRAQAQITEKEKIDTSNIPACKLFVDLKDGYFFSDYSKSCCKSFDTSLIDKGLVIEPESYLSKELKDLTLVETVFALGVLMVGLLSLFDPLTYDVQSLQEKFSFKSPDFLIGKLLSFSSGVLTDTSSGDFKFSDPYTGLEFSDSELNTITKAKGGNKRVKLEKAVGSCVFNSLCTNENNFEKNTENIHTDVLGSTIDGCLDKNVGLLSGAAIGERASQCSLNIDFANGSYKGNLNQNCCTSFSTGDQELRTDFQKTEKEVRDYVLIVVLLIIEILLSAGLYGLKALDSDLRASYQTRRSELLARAAEAGAAERLGSLTPGEQISGGIFSNIEDESINSENTIDKSLLKGPRGIRVTKKQLEERKKNLEDYLSLCTEDILCTLRDKTFFSDGKIYQNTIPIILNVCLNDIGIRLRGSIGNPCVCTEKGCVCKEGSICRSGACKDESSCLCNKDNGCLCPENKVCKKVQCEENNCFCKDSLCNTHSDCNSGEQCKITSSSSSGGTFSGVSESLGSSSSSGGSNSSNKGVCESISSSSSCENGKSCDDGNVCTANDQCINGKCKGTEKNCDDGKSCTDDTCDAATGLCISTNNLDCKECTNNSECESGLCIIAPKGNICTRTAENDCPEGYRPKICAPKVCKRNNECGSIGACKNGKCVIKPGKCGTDDNCVSGEVCDNQTSTCKPGSEGQDCGNGNGPCVVFPVSCLNVKCSNGQVCKNGKCVVECKSDTECIPPKVCKLGRCLI